MIKPSDINAPHVSIEQKADGLLIHVSAKEGETAPNGLRYHHDFACTFACSASGWLFRRGSYSYGEPRWGSRLRVKEAAGAVRVINAYLHKAAGQAWW